MTTPTVSDSRTFGRILAYVTERIEPGIKDTVGVHSPAVGIFLAETLGASFGATRLSGAGRKLQTGGERIRVNHRLGRSTNSNRLAGQWANVSTAAQDNVRPAFYNWKHYSGAATFSFFEELVSMGETALANLVTEEMDNEVRSLAELIGEDIYADGGADAINTLANLISADDSIGGLDGTNYVKNGGWNARGLSARGTVPASIDFASGAFSTQGLADLRTCWYNATEGSQQPTVGLTGQTNLARYEGVLQPQERYTNASMADGGFMNLAFKTVPMIADSKCEEMASGTIFLVNTNATRMVVLSGADFQFRPPHEAQNQEATSAKLLWKGQLVTDDRRLNNKMTSVTD